MVTAKALIRLNRIARDMVTHAEDNREPLPFSNQQAGDSQTREFVAFCTGTLPNGEHLLESRPTAEEFALLYFALAALGPRLYPRERDT